MGRIHDLTKPHWEPRGLNPVRPSLARQSEASLAWLCPPSPQPCRSQTDHGQDPRNAPHTAGAFDRAEKAPIVIAGDSNAGEVGTHDPQQCEENPQRARQACNSCLQLGNAGVKGCGGLVEARRRRDRRERAPEPPCHGRARDADPRSDGGVACVLYEARRGCTSAGVGISNRDVGMS